MKEYWNDKKRFADLFNGLVFHGRNVVEPDKLTNEDSAYEDIVSNKDVVGTVERFRDVVKMWTDNAM